MKKHVTLALFLSGILVGAGVALCFHPSLAQAQSAMSGGVWQYGESHWTQVNTAWRINTMTGDMELCYVMDGKPTCFVMPKPGGSTAVTVTTQ